MLRDRDSNGDGSLDERLWVAQDANYNVVSLFDNSGNVVERYAYDPFGQVTVLDADWNVRAASAFGWLYLHQGGRFDSVSGLYYFRHRDYSPTLGRWTSLDPIRYAAGDVNLYRYVFNAPTAYVDPIGLAGIDSPRAKLTNAMARGDVAEIEAILKTIKETAPNLLTKELEAAARAVIQRQLAQQAARTTADRIAQREIQEAFAAQFARITPKNADAIRGAIMRAFFKHGFEPRKTDTFVQAMRSYQQVARDAIQMYRRNAAKESGELAKKWMELARNQEVRLERINDWFIRNGLKP